jgi:hypothetical protein
MGDSAHAKQRVPVSETIDPNRSMKKSRSASSSSNDEIKKNGGKEHLLSAAFYSIVSSEISRTLHRINL